MVMVRLGKKGQVSLPKALLKQVGINGEMPLIAEAADDGAIVLRQAAVYPVEIYSNARIEEFMAGDRLSRVDAARVRQALRGKRTARKRAH
jgi:bifunctional DNA-binding transcriptional regulator/antitoxin component of YhaV-PrlF toxin-antitoxin module